MGGKRKAGDASDTSARDVLRNWNEYYMNNNFGIGVQCSQCQKWRLTYQYQESKEVPDDWTCAMWKKNGKRSGNCDEPSTLTEADFAVEEYPPGTVVWAKQAGYSWWPAMIEDSPDTQEFFATYEDGEDEYHVNFFGEKPLRSWIKASNIKDFGAVPAVSRSGRKRNKPSPMLVKAIQQAEEASKMPIKERLKKYSFVVRYQGRWAKIKNKDEISLPPATPRKTKKIKVVPKSSITNGFPKEPAPRKSKTVDNLAQIFRIKMEPDEELPAVCPEERIESRNEVAVKKETDASVEACHDDVQERVQYREDGHPHQVTGRISIESVESINGNEEGPSEGEGAAAPEEDINESEAERDTREIVDEAPFPARSDDATVVLSSSDEEEDVSPEQLAYMEFLKKKFPSFVKYWSADVASDDGEGCIVKPWLDDSETGD